jgi:transcriptional regulator GlxA family with amidase domain
MSMAPAPLDIAILVFDDVEALDLAGPYEVFTTANRVHQRQHPASPAPFAVRCVARTTEVVRARAGLRLQPDSDFATCPQPDVLVVPGGAVDAPLACAATLAWIAQSHPRTHITASVCTGAFLLAAAGVLTQEPVTTHWEDIADLRLQFPHLDVRDDQRWIDNGRTVTSAGISAGMDMSLHLVSRLAGEALAHRTARQMDYPWTTNPPSR